MTKYILNSGAIRKNEEKAKKFFAEVLDGASAQPRILLCFFAQVRESWEKQFSTYSIDLPRFFTQGVVPTFDLAFPDKFEEQSRNSDVILIHGGDDHLLMYWLNKFNVPKIWDGKVVAVSSAGSDVMVKHFWTCDWRKCMDGLGILPVKFIPHFKSNAYDDDPRGPIDWDKAHKELEVYGDKSLPIYALLEGDFAVFEV